MYVCMFGLRVYMVGPAHPAHTVQNANKASDLAGGAMVSEFTISVYINSKIFSPSPTVRTYTEQIYRLTVCLTMLYNGTILFTNHIPMANNEAQNEAIYSGESDVAGTTAKHDTYLAGSGDVVGTAVVQAPVTATAFQVSTKRASDLYITINTAAALAIAIGPTSACAIALAASASYALGTTTILVPAGWYVKLTGTMANLTVTSVVR